MERNVEDQTQGAYSSDWDIVGEQDDAAISEHDRLPAARESKGRDFAAYSNRHSLMTPQPSQEASFEEARMGQLLTRLDASAHRLANIKGHEILPLVLDIFLSLCSAGRGLALTYPEGAAACRVALCQQVPESMAGLFTQEACFWQAQPAQAHMILTGRVAQDVAGSEASDTLVDRLAAAGVQWYAWLPLAVGKRVEVVLIALGDGASPPAPVRDLLLSALAVLGSLMGAALEHARLRHLLERKEHSSSEFLTLASHELKSPLTVIKGYSQLLLRQARRGESTGAVDIGGLEVINQQVSRMSNLVAELLDASRIERGILEVQLQPVDLIALVRRVVSQRQRAMPNLPFHLVTHVPALMVLGDPARVEQVLGQLLDNAVRFGREEGPVEVLVQRTATAALPGLLLAAAAEPPENRSASNQNEVALVVVRDYGLGLPAGEHSLLFTAFYRGPEQGAHRQLAGLGLGLYLSRYLMTRQHGYLWAEFPVDEGTTGSIFSFTLPLAPQP